jgi:hypothetical protein
VNPNNTETRDRLHEAENSAYTDPNTAIALALIDIAHTLRATDNRAARLYGHLEQ